MLIMPWLWQQKQHNNLMYPPKGCLKAQRVY